MARHTHRSTEHDTDAERVTDHRTGGEHARGAHPVGAHPVDRETTAYDARERHDRHDRHEHVRDAEHEDPAHEKFGGLNPGAVFFGWLVAVAVTILLIGIVGAVLAALGSNASFTQSDAERAAGTIGVGAGITMVVVLAIAYYAGGYVAGRMSRYDGKRQGVGVWVLGLVVTLVAVGLGALFGDQYNVLDRVDLPRIPLSGDELGLGGLITAAAVLLVSLLAAVLGGTIGHRYHHRVDRLARR